MYIKSARITNIRSIEDFEITFDEPAGWHVLIGDNGSGKSTIIRSLALALVGPDEAPGLRADWRDWLSFGKDEGNILLNIEQSIKNDHTPFPLNEGELLPNKVSFKRVNEIVNTVFDKNESSLEYSNPIIYNWNHDYGWFSVAYGPYRRFSGGGQEWSKVFENQPKLGAHLSAFGEDVALIEINEWLSKLYYQSVDLAQKRLKEVFTFRFGDRTRYSELSNNNDIAVAFDNLETGGTVFKDINNRKLPSGIFWDLKNLINTPKFLPNNTLLESISSEGIFFRDGNGNLITINQLSDGYRSILSLTFELIRQLIRVYGEDAVFKNIREDKMYIDLPGVVLIDEIDAHLHPTWQTKIGQWFLKYFPNLQFIVTTHSPLVCRAAIKGTIWKLAEPGSDEQSKQITGIDRDRLIYGNLVEAYGTGAFEEDVSPSENAQQMRKELADLSKKSFKGIITDSEKKRMNRIQEILPTS